jgi:hypothetical protein
VRTARGSGPFSLVGLVRLAESKDLFWGQIDPVQSDLAFRITLPCSKEKKMRRINGIRNCDI